MAKRLPLALGQKLALVSPHPRFKHAALVLRGGALLAQGYNHDGRHAEVVALSKLWPSKRRGTTLLSLRMGPEGLAMARPCAECARFLADAGVERVYFSNRAGEIELYEAS